MWCFCKIISVFISELRNLCSCFSVVLFNGCLKLLQLWLLAPEEVLIFLGPILELMNKVTHILLGKFQNDALEAHFGAYRQMSGANYYISFIQVLESERKLKFKSCIIISAKNNNTV